MTISPRSDFEGNETVSRTAFLRAPALLTFPQIPYELPAAVLSLLKHYQVVWLFRVHTVCQKVLAQL